MPGSLQHLPQERADRFTRPFARFLRIEATAGGVLLLCTAVALAWSNSPWADAYRVFWDTSVGLHWNGWQLSHPLRR